MGLTVALVDFWRWAGKRLGLPSNLTLTKQHCVKGSMSVLIGGLRMRRLNATDWKPRCTQYSGSGLRISTRQFFFIFAFVWVQAIVGQTHLLHRPCDSLGPVIFDGSQSPSACNSSSVARSVRERENSVSECVMARILKFCNFNAGPMLELSNCFGKTCNYTLPSDSTICYLIGMGFRYVEGLNDRNHTCGVPKEFSFLFYEEWVDWVIPYSDVQVDCQLNIPKGARLSRKFICADGAPHLMYMMQLQEDIAESSYSYTLDPLCSVTWGITGSSVFRSEEPPITEDTISECAGNRSRSASPLIHAVLGIAFVLTFL